MTEAEAPEAPAAIAALDLIIVREPVAADQVVDGAPTTGFTTVTTFGELEVGVWEMTVGAMQDVESDEFFVVIAGRATVTFDADDRVMNLSVGSVARLAAGEHTMWTVTETIRKVYIAPVPIDAVPIDAVPIDAVPIDAVPIDAAQIGAVPIAPVPIDAAQIGAVRIA